MTSNQLSNEPLPEVPIVLDTSSKVALRRFQLGAIILLMAFALPLWGLVRLALKTEIQSHTLLIPFIVAYLWKTAPRPQSSVLQPSPIPSFVAGLLGFLALIGYWILRKGSNSAPTNALSFSTTAFLLFLLALALAVGSPGTELEFAL